MKQHLRVQSWPGETVTLAGLMTQVKSASLLATGQKIKFQQDRYRVSFTGLPEKAPDDPITTLAIECEAEPTQDALFVRRRARAQA